MLLFLRIIDAGVADLVLWDELIIYRFLENAQSIFAWILTSVDGEDFVVLLFEIPFFFFAFVTRALLGLFH